MDFAYTRKRGDTIELDVTLSLGGQPLKPSTLTNVWFTAKKQPSDADPGLFQKTLTPTNGIAAIDDNNGQVRITIAPIDTASLTTSTLLHCDVQVKESSGRVTTVLEGTLTITVDITTTS